ncbi:MAG: phospho-sugar mutase [Flavobacteriia bacterium]|nr:phospho-sugar mutase [Flavobacteriia bacterium]OIP47991.1 MAG: phosphoglucomutase [Flavobacteriaceae bacterium CG2_30_31_66]PIV96148.1 MAG: phosphoglucomutase [Flavobacteriaceae bacterium CG17_big_fil_post_rev_8_21_14_2_50_31_13]PIX12984.1 MAG: phosphoglucomutase [Flavobacteriaceae bacterium CG_4_8_14_3_um_filter_31_8]PIY14365.1 MAG: phosphoglucomutase [Flavobacteriaceae bacterium CG_4_10_14_3_um_filter_31_253]PIZ10452.1 MAG: phosphoglucomutase [Flavobacteriaceae bacterium CG_4_10_14_0_8_um
MDSILQKATAWLTPTFDAETKAEIQNLIDNNPNDLADRFYKDMEFGTGGMRGVMGVGTNRINKYTLGRATQGLSNYLLKNVKKPEIKVAIAYDCRHNSKKFAKIVADVLSANNIKVFLFEDLRPTPVLSFSVRHLNCDAGIVLTASHNPPEYNGYKVYWADGGQIVPPHDSGIINEVYAIDFSEINFKANEHLIETIGKNVDAVFIAESVKNASLSDKINRNDLKIVFTSIHGTSIVSVPDALKKAGYTDVHIVEEQREPNGDFPTVKSPNPEEPEALKMATDLANKIGADIVIGTDPDCDRLGVAVRDAAGNIKLMNGNQTMVVMTNFLLKKWKEEGRINGKQFVGSTIVSTELVNEVAAKFGVETKVGLTGFKWIAKMVVDFPEQEFIGGGEESFGYMVGDFVRDKDAVTATLLACEVAAYAKQHGGSFYDELLNIYIDNNFYKEHLISLTKKGMEGAAEIQKMLSDMRNNPLSMIDGEKVATLADYEESVLKDIRTGKETKIELPKSNVLIYQTENGTRIAARPSGTEPKIKFYFSVNAPLDSKENAAAVEAALDAKIQRIIKEMTLV